MSATQFVRLLPLLIFITACLPAEGTTSAPRPTTRPPTRTPRPPATASPIQLSGDMIDTLAQLEAQVQTLRGLEPTSAIARTAVSSEALENRILDKLEQAETKRVIENEAVWFQLLEWAPASFDWWTFQADFSTEQPMSFYDESTGELIVVADQPLTPVARLNYVHEYANALVAAVFDPMDSFRLSATACADNRDRCRAARALIEGDASLVEEQWLRVYASEDEIAELTGFYQAYESPSFAGAPPAVQDGLLFPFQHGLEFVRSFHVSGGWAAVDALYRRPPISTEMILHPHAYPDDTPRALVPPEADEASLGSGWRQIAGGTLGEHALQLTLNQRLPIETAEQAAQGWYGDHFIAFIDDTSGSGAWVVVHIWDTIRDSQQAFLAWREYGDQRLGEHDPEEERYLWRVNNGVAVLERASNQTLWLMAPDQNVADRLRSAISFPLGLE